MKRCLVLGALIGIGSLSIIVAGFQAPPAGPTQAALAATKIERVKNNLYIITGSGVANTKAFSGGNTAVFITNAGVVVVDTKLPGWGPTILQRIKTVTEMPVTTIINTHTHLDHTGSNEAFGTMVDSVVHENTKANMAMMDEFKGDKAKFLPKRTFKDRFTMFSGQDEIDLYYFGRGHTNGDTFVVFPAIKTMHVGDMYAWKALPYIDAGNGGSVIEHPQTLAKAIATLNKNIDTIISGHIPVSSLKDLKEYAEFTQDFADYARDAMKAGKTVDQAAAEYKVPSKFKGYVASVNPDSVNAKTNLQIAYDELKK
jgi:glyoxylase-like metal-dependent hydrolase (beta-lactamase superfamily II)